MCVCVRALCLSRRLRNTEEAERERERGRERKIGGKKGVRCVTEGGGEMTQREMEREEEEEKRRVN